MKKIIIGVVLVVALAIAGYFAYDFFGKPSIYQLTLQSELNPTDFQEPGGQNKQIRETYDVPSLGRFHVDILQYSDVSSASEGISKLKKKHNPAMIVLNTKYVNYYPDLSSDKFNHYFYQSGENIAVIDHTGTKDNADAFIIWYYSKYPNQ